jgi:hypothetical protein
MRDARTRGWCAGRGAVRGRGGGDPDRARVLLVAARAVTILVQITAC